MKVLVGPNPQSRSSSQGSLVEPVMTCSCTRNITVVFLVTQSSTLGLKLHLFNKDKSAYDDNEFRYWGNYGDDPLDGYEDDQEGDHDIDQEIDDFPPRLDSLSDA